MTRITPEHLARGAFIYVRQSTNDQVLSNHESRRRQYGLVDRARALGWVAVEVIDDDLGRSGSGIARPGFEKLLAAICEGRVGAVLSIEASRLARNGRDWHTLLEFCGLVGTLIVDEDGLYDPRHPNDRLLLGMKGTMSEMELSLFRQRSLEALKQKARRGELFLTVAIGYLKSAHDRIEKDPDRRVQEAITLVFAKFTELQTVRQVHLWMRQERLPLPATEYGPEGRKVVWKLPVYNTLHHLLTNPIYAGAYAFGRTGSRLTIEAGRKRIVRGFRKDRSAWEVLIRDHHEGYIGWAEFERNQRLISDNANGKSFLSRGSIRRGEALLAGLLRCGHCGRKLHVAYSGENGSSGRYHCRGGHVNHGGDPCISFGGMRIDRAVGAEVIEQLQPLGIEAAISAMEARHAENAEKRRQVDLALEQARYEAGRARRQYDAVDPNNRLVAAELEQRWNNRLLAVRALEDERDALAASSHTTATASRSQTWVEACQLQETMFEVTASLGELASQLAFYRGGEFRVCPWVLSAAELAGQMRQVYCVAGGTQISRVLRHALAETKMQRVGAVIFVGDAMEEQPQQLYPLAQELGRLETPLFVFQEGQVDVVAATFRQLAAFSGGAYLSFDLAGIERLKELLGAIAIYAVGGHEALVKASRTNEGARLLLTHLRR